MSAATEMELEMYLSLAVQITLFLKAVSSKFSYAPSNFELAKSENQHLLALIVVNSRYRK